MTEKQEIQECVKCGEIIKGTSLLHLERTMISHTGSIKCKEQEELRKRIKQWGVLKMEKEEVSIEREEEEKLTKLGFSGED